MRKDILLASLLMTAIPSFAQTTTATTSPAQTRTVSPLAKPTVTSGTTLPREVASDTVVGWVQNGILLITFGAVIWYTRETARLRRETHEMVAEAQHSRLQAEAASVVDAEIRLYDKTRGWMSWSDRETLLVKWIPHTQCAMFNDKDLRKLLQSKRPEKGDIPSLNEDATFSIEKLLDAIPNRRGDPELSAGARRLSDSLHATTHCGEVEMALEECEFLIRLINGPCKNTSQVAIRNLRQYERIRGTLLSYLALQKLLTGDADCGETYLAHLEKDGAEPKDLIRKIRQALKPAGWQPPETT
jgi:hypothetical protein